MNSGLLLLWKIYFVFINFIWGKFFRMDLVSGKSEKFQNELDYVKRIEN